MNTLEIAEATKTHIKNKARQNGGSFPLKDIPQGRKLKLEFNKIQKSKIGTISENEYFVCANFTGKNGDNYDVDIFMKKTGDGNYKPSGKKPKVREENGDPRYIWEKEDEHYIQANKGIEEKKIHPDKDEVQSSQPTRRSRSNRPRMNNNRNQQNNRGNEQPGFNPNNNRGNNQFPNNNRPNNNMPGNQRPGNNQPGGNMPNNNNMPGNNQPGENFPNNNTPNNNNRPNNNRGPN